MKKKLVCLAVLLLAMVLLFIPTTATSPEYDSGYIYCPQCNLEWREVDVVRLEYHDPTYHHIVVKCRTCGIEVPSALYLHSGAPAATCTTPQTCTICNTTFLNPMNHTGGTTTSYENDSSSCHRVNIICNSCQCVLESYLEDHIPDQLPTCTQAYHCQVCGGTYGEALGHSGGEATCTAGAVCERCDVVYADPLGHDLIKHDGKAPTCTEIGWDAYETCSRCDYSTYKELPALGHSYTTEIIKPTCTAPGSTIRTCQRCKQSTTEQTGSTLSHWYSEWKPERHGSNGTHIASCLRWCGYQLSVPCTQVSYTQMLTDEKTEKLDLCPVCGQVSDGSRLELVKDAKAAALTRELPAGEVVVRVGVLENGQALMSVAFEISGELTQPTGQVKITLPSQLLDGHSLSLVDEDGRETELEFDIQKEEASFVLDFTPNQLDEEKEPSPTARIHLVPAE